MQSKIDNDRTSLFDNAIFSDRSTAERLRNYSEQDYCYDVKTLGLKAAWEYICRYVSEYGEQVGGYLNTDNFGEMYETGLAITNKHEKKENGQYFTPYDVSLVMSHWLQQVAGYNICDVACGTGNLILTYFKLIGEQKTKEILSEGRLYLYDSDALALQICKTSVAVKYGTEYSDMIHCICGDFLSPDTVLPVNCKVICNPPYSTLNSLSDCRNNTAVLQSSKELYAAFAEKIFTQSSGSVIITPFSFIGGEKFYPLRRIMNDYNGFIVSFDNVPGNIFCGQKLGIFNSNKSNSVRAAITVVENKKDIKGFRLSPLIRFKREERESLLRYDVLKNFISDEYQTVDVKNTKYYKCDKRLADVWEKWRSVSTSTIGQYVTAAGKYSLFVPNTCRYFTTAGARSLKRQGQIHLCFDDRDVFNFVFCIVNSSFAYWYWRLYDGGITYPKGLLLNLPLFYDILSDKDKKFFADISKEMIRNSDKYIVTKNNVGIQENIKYPSVYRDKINQRLLDILKTGRSSSAFDCVHSNRAFEKCLPLALSGVQDKIMREFYSILPTKVVFSKSKRKAVWNLIKNRRFEEINLSEIRTVCPSLADRADKSFKRETLVQSAVFSECAYSQTLANMLNLSVFINCSEAKYVLPENINELLNINNLHPRYIYTNTECSRLLVQAGGCNGVDCALIDVAQSQIYTIEFKESYAKTSEVDLPKYAENGVMTVTDAFLKKYPQFGRMLNEHTGLNFFENIGHNICDFSYESVAEAVENNYSEKHADVICTEDSDGNLVMLPANHITHWAEVKGEIRTAGRNSLKVWSHGRLNDFLAEKGAVIRDGTVTLNSQELASRISRGGVCATAYKINPLFFVRNQDCTVTDKTISFKLNRVRQLKPTVTGKIQFKGIKHQKVKDFYFI